MYNGILAYFSIKKCSWRIDMIQNSLWVLTVFLERFFGPKCASATKLVYYFASLKMLAKAYSNMPGNELKIMVR